MRIRRVLETCLYVDDLVVAERFYVDVLELEFVNRLTGRHVFLRCGQNMLLLFDPLACHDESSDIPPHGARGPGHVAFAVNNADLQAWRERLASFQVHVERDIVWPGGGGSIYFRDPAGNSLELASPRLWGLSEELATG